MRTTLALISLFSKSYNILPGINKDLNTDLGNESIWIYVTQNFRNSVIMCFPTRV